MTTEAAARLYLAEHLMQWGDKGYAVYNPNSRAVDELPVIYGFNNGGERDWWTASLLTQDGSFCGGHICSAEGYMPHDLGVLHGSRPDRHEHFRTIYPDGYRMDFVPGSQVLDHPGLKAAYANHLRKADDAERIYPDGTPVPGPLAPPRDGADATPASEGVGGFSEPIAERTA